MSNVLRRIDAPTRYGGLPIKAWLGLAFAVTALFGIVQVARTPLLPTLVGISWFVAAPAVVLLMWAHQQGVSIGTLTSDFLRYSLRRHRRPIVHQNSSGLRGGIVIVGDLPWFRSPATSETRGGEEA